MRLSQTATAALSVAKPVPTFALQVTEVSLLQLNVRPASKVLPMIKTANASQTSALHAKPIQSASTLQTKPAFANNHS